MPTRFLSPEPLQVVPELVGVELASPRRRFAAFALDCVILWLPTLLVALGWATLTLWVQERPAFDALAYVLRHDNTARDENRAALRDLAPLLVRLEADGLPREVEEAVKAGDLDRAAAGLEATELLVAFSLDHEPPRVAPRPGGKPFVRLPLERLIPAKLRGVAAYGVAAVYFTLLTRSRRGATLGKRLMGMRVVRLDGHRLSLWEGVERFAGYLHIPGTLGLGLLDLWHDPNRRMAHDRAAHTAVTRVRRASTAQPVKSRESSACPTARPTEAPPPPDPPATANVVES